MGGVKQDHVGTHPSLDAPAVMQAQPVSCPRSQSRDGFLHRDQPVA